MFQLYCFTLYDGYYIYSPTYSEELKEVKVQERNKEDELVNVTVTEPIPDNEKRR